MYVFIREAERGFLYASTQAKTGLKFCPLSFWGSSAMAALQYLDSLRSTHPELGEWYNTLSDLYQRKLWHQLTLKLEQFVALAVFQAPLLHLLWTYMSPFECARGKLIWEFLEAGDALIQLYHNFITDFETKINLLKLAHFAVIVSRQYPEKEASIGYLEGVIEKLLATREMRIEEPILYIKMQIATFQLEKGSQKECKKLLEDGKSTLDSMTDIDPSVYADYYWVSSQYHKSRQEFAEFYKSALLYQAYTSVESLSESFKLDLAFDLSLAALLGENIYNFGELLAHPIVKYPYLKLRRGRRKKNPKVDGGEMAFCFDQNEALDKLYNVSQMSKVRRGLQPSRSKDL
ncbi:hypothetical protein HYC85_027597 [Camellia sinensis]|uniref:PSD13 N-terminal domain-containing protein n=1 Tax=Camellia sinensis TaxID=4442 RepID=A0A7J7GAG9_CAMSI|nr:hypothetical protein HYC85_027597 [Camellia sinensis]